MVVDKEFYVNLNLEGNEIKNVKVENVTTLPTGAAGRIVYLVADTGDAGAIKKGYYYHDGESWKLLVNKSEFEDVNTRLGVVEEMIGAGAGEEGNTSSIANKITALEEWKNSAAVTIASNTSAASEAKTAADKAQTTADNAATTASSNSTAITGLGTRLTTAEGKITNAEDAIKKLQDDVGGDNSGINGDIAALKDAVGTKGTSVTDSTGIQKDIFSIKADLEAKVDQVAGKGLSTEDFTTAEKTKLGAIAENAQVNVLEGVQVKKRDGSTSDLAVSGKKVVVDLSEYALKSDAVAALEWMGSVATKDALNSIASKKKGDMYHVEADGGEYVWNGSAWEAVGSIVDLSTYAKSAEVTTEINTAVSTAKTELTTEIGKKANSADLKTVATSGKYTDLTDTPVTDDAVKADSSNAVQSKAVKAELDKKVDKLAGAVTAGDYAMVHVEANGLVSQGKALTADKVPDLTSEKITDFATKVEELTRISIDSVAMKPSENWTPLDTAAIPKRPAAITAYKGGEVVGVAFRYNESSDKVEYKVNVDVTVAVEIVL